MSEDLIKRSDALSAAGDMSYIAFEIRRKIRMIPSAEPMPDYIDNILIARHYCNGMVAMNEECYKRMQSVDPITTEQAVEHLQECGWLPEHDRILTDSQRGEWIRDRYWSRGTGMGEEYGFFYKCSLCEYEVENGYTRCGFNFCPYCGAKMVKNDG